MRPYDDFSVVADDNKLLHHYNNNNSNANNQYYNRSGGNNSSASAIPYHARENSLPFSYGQLDKTSTPLRKTSVPASFTEYTSGGLSDFSVTGTKINPERRQSESNGGGNSMIKSQPRLTSPLLVRKTLGSSGGSRSPTRTNTIANTYHYNYETIPRTTDKSRNDFEQLLRERREKVYNEYDAKRRIPPEPPQRQINAATTTKNGNYTNGNTRSSDNYNYEIKFNLNLDDFDLQRVAEPKYTQTLDRSSYQTMAQPYQTRDIVDAAVATHPKSSYVERSSYTIKSTETKPSAVAYDGRSPLEVAYNQRLIDAQYSNGNGYSNNNSRNKYNTIGGSYNIDYQKTVSAMNARHDLSSPIYATTTKQLQQQQQQRSIQTRSGDGTNSSATAITSNRNEPDYPTTPFSTGMRSETPAFPVTPRTPFGSNNGNGIYTPQQQMFTHSPTTPTQETHIEDISTGMSTTRSRLNSSVSQVASPEPQEVAAHLVKFARNSAKYWYKPNLSREDAIELLLNAPPGTFVVRDSTTFKNAYGLVLRVAQPPPGSTGNQPQELVRHFLIEPTQRGVRLKGCANEPAFTSLSALIYEHSINQLALPCKLHIPEADILQPVMAQSPAQQHLRAHGAATNVLWLYSCETESLTGVEAIRKAIRQLLAHKEKVSPTEVHFKVSQEGITLTDNTRTKFFRKHYSAEIISYCAIDPDNRLWTCQSLESGTATDVAAPKKTIFAFVARRSPSSNDNQCHVFCDLNISQPASAIVAFANKTLPTEQQRNYVL